MDDRWYILKRKRSLKEWLVMFCHNKGNASFWVSREIRAETAEKAAMKLMNRISLEDHVSYDSKGLKVHVYEVNLEYNEFLISKDYNVERVK